jgi:hypothetical protein
MRIITLNVVESDTHYVPGNSEHDEMRNSDLETESLTYRGPLRGLELQAQKKPTWWDTVTYPTTSAYSETSPPCHRVALCIVLQLGGI